MKKFFSFLSIAAMALALVGCHKEEKPGPDVNNITEDGFYVVGEATGLSEVTAALTMATGINEAASQSARDGMYEKYIVLQAGKEFTLAYVQGGKQTAYGATLAEFKADTSTELYADNPTEAVFKGKLEVGDSAPKMKVSKTGLYHIVLDLNKNKDLDEAQIVLCPVTMGVRGGMNSWGFTALEATEASNDGITFSLSGQELAGGGEFKFAYNSAWKITLDGEGKVKANTNLGKDCKPGGDNIAVTEGAGTYKITLNYKLAAGDIANSFNYKVELEAASSAPETMYMIGQQFGDWKWEDAGVVELIPVWGKTGEFWCTRYFEADKGFKFCSTKAWNGDFTGAGTAGYTVHDGNCWVPENGFYTVYVDGNESVVEISPAEVYGIGAAFSNPAEWDFDKAPKFVADGDKLTIPVIAAEEMRMGVKVQPSTAKDGITANGWYDWWKTEFIFFDGKIAYRGAGGDQDRVKGEAGKTLVLDLNAGTAEYTEGGGPVGGDATIKDFAQEYVKILDVWQNNVGDINRLTAWEVAKAGDEDVVKGVHYIPNTTTITVAGKSYTIGDMLETALRSYLLLRGWDGNETEKAGFGNFPTVTPVDLNAAVPETHDFVFGKPLIESSNGGYLVKLVDGKEVPCQVDPVILDNWAQRSLNWPFTHDKVITNFCTYPREDHNITNYKGCFSSGRALITFAFFFKYMLDNNLEKADALGADVTIRSELFGNEGSATASIKTADELISFLANAEGDATLEVNIDLTGKEFTPGALKGNFDGKGHTVTYELTAAAEAVNAGLFATVEGTVKNLKVAGKIVTEAPNAGGIAGSTADDAVFENCESSVEISGPIKASYRLGGIVGLGGKNITIKNCVNNGKIGNAVADMGAGNAIQLGGIIGHIEETGTVEGCTNNGELYFEAKGTPRIGGMCGYINNLKEASFVNCTNKGNIKVASSADSGYNYVAGITGYYGTPNNASHVLYKKCVNEGDITFSAAVSATAYRVGGIMCHCGGTKVSTSEPLSVEVLNCSNSGNISIDGTSAKCHIGGIIGFTETITCIIKCDGCTNTGSITVAGKGSIGSLLGYSCNPASTFTNFTIGKDVVMTTAEGGRPGLAIGSGYISTDAIPDAELKAALTGKVKGGKIVNGATATEATAENYKDLLVNAGFVGSADGVTFGE